ncbi:hypothetical protein V6N13_018971 [Hibiscus sabdariffa]|uniref:Uncharacterized protein n=1 Tax=Hibiscus sabdariffa TaxID=183260 RepID=A0ABR2EKA1_9ROSI
MVPFLRHRSTFMARSTTATAGKDLKPYPLHQLHRVGGCASRPSPHNLHQLHRVGGLLAHVKGDVLSVDLDHEPHP